MIVCCFQRLNESDFITMSWKILKMVLHEEVALNVFFTKAPKYRTTNLKTGQKKCTVCILICKKYLTAAD